MPNISSYSRDMNGLLAALTNPTELARRGEVSIRGGREDVVMGESREFKVIVAGSRGFSDYTLLRAKLDALLAGKLADGATVTIVSGGARGADTLGERYAEERGLTCLVMPADWDRHGRSAGYKRNEEMANVANALVAFWDGRSPGTKHMIDIARQRGLAVRVVRA
jgi:hypothetical protein